MALLERLAFLGAWLYTMWVLRAVMWERQDRKRWK